MSNQWELELKFALDAVRRAMDVCRHVQSSITKEVLEKKDLSPVTIADYASQALICRGLEETFPEDPVLGEEDAAGLRTPEQKVFLNRIREELANVGVLAAEEEICRWIDHGGSQDFSERFWTLDPIDGTKGFLRGQQYAISLALLVEGQIQVGVLGCPNLLPTGGEVSQDHPSSGALFHAVRGGGAWVVSPENLQAPQPIRVRAIEDSAQAILCEPFESGHTSRDDSARMADLLGIVQPPIRLDSQAKYAVIARGEADIYLRLPSRPGYHEKIWDHAGGVLVVEEAGGRVTDIHGQPLDFTRGHQLESNQGVIVTNGRLHEPVLEAYLQKHQ